jgi:3-hydroxyisobutyrate dehydrogenase
MSPATAYGFIGLGHQGTPMVERMIDGGLRPWLWARRPEVLNRYRDREATLAASPAELGASCDVIGLCLYDAEATDAVLFGANGVMTSIRPGTILCLHATLGPQYVRDLAARIADRGVHVVDAPVSGGDEAATGNLLVMVGGHGDHIAACHPMFTTYANRVVNVGGLGAAQAVKLINNALMTAITGLVFDSFDLGAQFGVDPNRLGEVLAAGSASNPSVGYYLGLGGAEEFSIRAWPTLHKDVELVATVTDGTPLGQGLLVTSAVATIAEMAARRAGWVRARGRESDRGAR